jgi:hypothetical protein
MAAMSSDVATGRWMNGARRAHGAELVVGATPCRGGAVDTTTSAPSCNRSKLLLASTSPGSIPSTCVKPLSETPGLDGSHVSDVALDDVHEGFAVRSVEWQRRDQRHSAQRIDEEPRIDELVRE